MATPQDNPHAHSGSLTVDWSTLRCYQTLRYLEQACQEQLATALGDLDLNVFDSMLLMECCTHNDEAIAQNQLAELLNVSAAKVSLRLEALRKRGIVQPSRPSADRRRQLWQISHQGRQLVLQLAQRLRLALPDADHDKMKAATNSLAESITNRSPLAHETDSDTRAA